MDDAWIVSRVAWNGVETGTYSYGRGGPVTDAVTPLGFAQLVGGVSQLFGQTNPLAMWQVARALGLVACAISFFIAGHAVSDSIGHSRGRVVARSGLVLLCLPAAIWAGAGLETALVGLALLCSARFVERHASQTWSYVILGLPVVWRPELLPATVALGVILAKGQGRRHVFASLVLPVVPAVMVMLVRLSRFGHPLPLASIAKEADWSSGVFYAAVTVIWGGLPWLLASRRDFWRGDKPWGWVFVAHLLALVYAGGDWMPALRLTAPLYPWLFWKIGERLEVGRALGISLVPAVIFPALLLYEQGADLRAVSERRIALVEQGTKVLSEAQVVAAVDVGWVGLATDKRVVDLAGVTDPTVARLSGGHTSKAIYPGMFSDRDVDTWVIRAADRTYRPGDPLSLIFPVYVVDSRLLQRTEDLGFVGAETMPLAGTREQYVIARRALLANAGAPQAVDE